MRIEVSSEARNACGDVVDGHYYEAAPPGSWAERLMIGARARIYRDFLRLCRPRAGGRILDVGVSDVINDGANLIERLYPRQQEITAAGIGKGEQFRAAFPGIRYDQIKTGSRLPYADRSFDIATSNAVLEHVGSVAEQRAFVDEMTRVADCIFITVPHRYFPIEHHTAIPFAHWWDLTFAIAARALSREMWLKQENLILMDRRQLDRAAGRRTGWTLKIGRTGLPLGPFSSNLYLCLTRDAQSPPQTRQVDVLAPS